MNKKEVFVRQVRIFIFLTALIVSFGCLTTALAQSAEDNAELLTAPPAEKPVNAPGETKFSNYENDPSFVGPPKNLQSGSAADNAGGGLNIGLVPTGQEGNPLGKSSCGPEGDSYRLCVPFLGQTLIKNSLAGYVALIYRLALGMAGLLVFIMVVWGGIQYTLSANTSRLEEARDRIKQAVIGLVLLALSYIILNTINPDLVQLKEPGGGVALPAVLPSLEQQAAENRKAHTFEESVKTALVNPEIFREGSIKQEEFLQGQIGKELGKPEPDVQKVVDWQKSLDQARAIRAEVERRSHQ